MVPNPTLQSRKQNIKHQALEAQLSSFLKGVVAEKYLLV